MQLTFSIAHISNILVNLIGWLVFGIFFSILINPSILFRFGIIFDILINLVTSFCSSVHFHNILIDQVGGACSRLRSATSDVIELNRNFFVAFSL